MNAYSFHRILFSCLLFPFSAGALTMDFVTVGDLGNLADPANSGSVAGIGAVGASFGIGTYEVTNSQYTEFLNSVDLTGANSLELYDSRMGTQTLGGIVFNSAASPGSKFSIKTGSEQMPVVFVSFFDAARFTNWLHNGQGSGSTETGAYTLTGGAPTPNNADTVARNSGAQYWVPSESEWYKAAYFQPASLGGDADNYWQYPMRTNLTPFSDVPPGATPDNLRVGNFYAFDSIANGFDDGYAVTGAPGFVAAQNYLTQVGAFASSWSYSGTFDQGGNVSEWTDTIGAGASRGVRGGSWGVNEVDLRASSQGFLDPSGTGNVVGFRVAATVPEPAAIGLSLLGALGLAFRRGKRG